MLAHSALRTTEPELLIDLERDGAGRLALARVPTESSPVLVREILGTPDTRSIAKASAPCGGQPSWLLGTRLVQGEPHLISRWVVGISALELLAQISDRSEGIPLQVATTIAAAALEQTLLAQEGARRYGISPALCSLSPDALWLTPDGMVHLSEGGFCDWLAGIRAGGARSGPGPRPPWAVAQALLRGLARPELDPAGKRERLLTDLLAPPSETATSEPSARLLERLRREPQASPEEMSHWTRLLCGDRMMERQALSASPNPGLSLIDCKTSLFHFSDLRPDLMGETPPRGGPPLPSSVSLDAQKTRLAVRDTPPSPQARPRGGLAPQRHEQGRKRQTARRRRAGDELLPWLTGALLAAAAAVVAYGLIQ